MSQPFPSNNLKLSSVLQAYNITDMKSLIGKEYYDSSGNTFIVEKPINLGIFKGNYYNSASGSFDCKKLSNFKTTEYGTWSDVTAEIDINSISYVINGPKLVSFQVTFARYATTTYALGNNIWWKSTSYSITVDGIQKYFTNDDKSDDYLFDTGVVSCSGSVLTLSFSMDAYDDTNNTVGVSARWIFGISGNTLTLTSEG